MVPTGWRAYRRDLPHWRREGATYFLTWCLCRSQPALNQQERRVAFETIRYRDQVQFHLHGLVIMDDHVHVLVRTFPEWSIDRLQHSWKSFSAHRLQREIQRKGRVWQEEAWDRIVRTEAELGRELRYIKDNPERRWPGIGSYPWLWVEELK